MMADRGLAEIERLDQLAGAHLSRGARADQTEELKAPGVTENLEGRGQPLGVVFLDGGVHKGVAAIDQVQFHEGILTDIDIVCKYPLESI